MKKKIAILGSGAVSQALARGLASRGHDVRIGNRSAEKLADFSKESGIPVLSIAEACAHAELIVLAVLGRAAKDVLAQAGEGNLAGKVVIDTTNPIADAPPDAGILRFFTGPNESLMERLQAAHPTARFVKAFNSVGSAFMVDPKFPGGPPTMFYCGNDATAKKVVAELIRELGWEGEDVGEAAGARAIEPLCQLWCAFGFRENRWTQAFRMLKL